MTFDPDLTTLLEGSTNEDLDPIVRYILKAATNTLDVNDTYKANAGNHLTYVGVLVKEIREFGGNSILNIFREGGVPYAEIVSDVASKLKVKVGEGESVEGTERKVLLKILGDSIDKMTPADRSILEEELKRLGVKGVSLSAGVPGAVIAGQVAVEMTGFLAYRVSVVVANAVAKAVLGAGLSTATNAGLTRVIGAATGPIGMALTAAWTLADLAGPAYRVTIPVVCHVAFLRHKQAIGEVPA